MKLCGRRLLLLIVLTALPVTTQAGFHALVIGCQKYRHLTKLETPLADAKEVAEMLEQQYGFTVELLIDKTRDEIMLALSELRKTMTKEEDNLLIYYAGHGYLDEPTNTGYWQPVDAEKDNTVKWIPTDEITRLLKAIRAKHALVVADSCYSGTMIMRDSGEKLAANMEKNEWLERMQKRRSRTALTSGLKEPVMDGGGGSHSVFAKAFLEALQENRKILDGNTLFDLIKNQVAANARQTPMYGVIQMTDHDQGDFLFVPTGKKTITTIDENESVPDSTRGGDGPISPLETMTDATTGMVLVKVPGGCFDIGSASSEEGHQDDEGPIHKVCLKNFWMGKYEVTQGKWKKIMGENPAEFKSGDNYPVEKVSWNDIQEFLDKLNKKSGGSYRLPTEAEWEYACRAGGSGKYCGGDDLDAVAWHEGNSDSTTHSVGKKQGNRFGLYDMSGNVMEWCSDWYGSNYYAKRVQDDPHGPAEGSRKVIRGGGYIGPSLNCRSVKRNGDPPELRNDTLGFRLVLPTGG